MKDHIMSMLSWMSEGLIFAKVMLIFSFHVYIAMMIFFLERVGYLQIITIVLFYPKYNNLIRKKGFMIPQK